MQVITRWLIFVDILLAVLVHTLGQIQKPPCTGDLLRVCTKSVHQNVYNILVAEVGLEPTTSGL
jgi:hypothetical protein